MSDKLIWPIAGTVTGTVVGADVGAGNALRRILEHYDLRSELYTNDADLAAGMAAIAREAVGADVEAEAPSASSEQI
jgi:hypothetical protein